MIKSTQTANQVLDTNLASVWLTLYLETPNPDGSTPEAPSIVRQTVTFDVASNGQTQNSADVVYVDIPPATYVGWGLYDADTAGNLIYLGELTTPITFTESGGELRFETGNIRISEA